VQIDPDALVKQYRNARMGPGVPIPAEHGVR
jgi:hypothetical protein